MLTMLVLMLEKGGALYMAGCAVVPSAFLEGCAAAHQTLPKGC